MYEIKIITPEKTIVKEINDMTELETVLFPYRNQYTGIEANFKEGQAKVETEEAPVKKYNTTTRITDFNINWKKIKSACMTTISKEAGDKEPSHEWKRKLLICEHSPIRRGTISWKWDEIPYAISTHFVRHHEGVEKWVGTQRADRTVVKDRSQRSQMDTVPMEMEANIQAILNISYKRLCTCADPTTRAYWQSVIEAIREYDEDIFWACVPQCIRCGGCPEYAPCGFYDALTKDWTAEELKDVHTRYNKYNEYTLKKIKK